MKGGNQYQVYAREQKRTEEIHLHHMLKCQLTEEVAVIEKNIRDLIQTKKRTKDELKTEIHTPPRRVMISPKSPMNSKTTFSQSQLEKQVPISPKPQSATSVSILQLPDKQATPLSIQQQCQQRMKQTVNRSQIVGSYATALYRMRNDNDELQIQNQSQQQQPKSNQSPKQQLKNTTPKAQNTTENSPIWQIEYKVIKQSKNRIPRFNSLLETQSAFKKAPKWKSSAQVISMK